MTPLRLAELSLEADLPPGVLNIVPGYGSEVGAALAAHPGIAHLSFTGSSRRWHACGNCSRTKNCIPVTLELGGKLPNIVFADSDLDAAAPVIVN